MDYSAITNKTWIENEKHFIEKFKDENIWNSVPLLNANELHHLKDNTLVRFYGMVQDMYNPEYYLEKYEIENKVTKEKTIRYLKYGDTTDLTENEVINFNSPQNVTRERHTLVMISLPGLNEWVHDIEKEHKIKPCENNPTPSTSQKRSIEEEEPMETEVIAASSDNKRICNENKATPATTIVSREHILNFPLPDRDGKCCHVKVYENGGSFKLNEMVDILGFLSVNPMLIEVNYDNEDDTEIEIQTHHPPPSLVPRIHCVLFKKMDYYNPLLKTISLENQDILHLYKELTLIFTHLLFGDKLAAEYLIYHMISKVYLHTNILALGKFTLNISNIPTEYPDYGEKLYEFMQLLLPKSHYLPMTLDNMNELVFTPKKDYTSSRLTSGVLQLSNNTHLLLDETKFQPGQLNNIGCKGIAALSTTIKVQKVEYNFKYYQIFFDCDIPILIISEGKSLLPSNFHVPLLPDEQCVSTFPEILKASKQFLKPDLLNNLRVYLTKVRHATYELSNNVLDLVQNDFVNLRQDENISEDYMHQLLVLARLICLSQGKESLDEACWRQACQMEAERKARVAARPSLQ